VHRVALVEDMREAQFPVCFPASGTPFAEVREKTVEKGSENTPDAQAQPESPFPRGFPVPVAFVMIVRHVDKEGGPG